MLIITTRQKVFTDADRQQIVALADNIYFEEQGTTNTLYNVFGVTLYREYGADYGYVKVDFMPDELRENSDDMEALMKGEVVDHLFKAYVAVRVLIELGFVEQPTHIVGETNSKMALFAKKRLGFVDRLGYEQHRLQEDPSYFLMCMEEGQPIQKQAVIACFDNSGHLDPALQKLRDHMQYMLKTKEHYEPQQGTREIIADYETFISSVESLQLQVLAQRHELEQRRAARIAKGILKTD